MEYRPKILADSISELGHRLTTIEVSFWRKMLAEFNTHRALNRNSASSRAVPTIKQLEQVLNNPFIPDKFGINQPGMQSFNFHDGLSHEECVEIWLTGRMRDVTTTLELLLGRRLASRLLNYDPIREVPTLEQVQVAWPDITRQLSPKYRRENPADVDEILNVHKQLSSRPLEMYMVHTVIVTATEWSNFFALRTDGGAQRELFLPAKAMQRAMAASTPRLLRDGEWHLPLVFNSAETDPVGFDYADWRQNPDPRFWAGVSAARCARVSYLTHDGGVRDLTKDQSRFTGLVEGGHMSPLEHQARPMTAAEFKSAEWSGNLRGWHQFRKDIVNEDDFSKVLAQQGY